MSLADEIIDRQRLRRKVTFWRVVSFIAALIVLGVVANSVSNVSSISGKARDHIARIDINGGISEDEELLKRLADIADSDAVKGVILSIDSPGGTTAGGEAIYDAVREIAEDKPVVAQVGTLAASAGYMIAVGADHIVARKTSIVGSIGVIFQYPKIDGLLETIGVDIRAIKSTPLKAEPSFFGETPPGAEAMIRRLILDSFDWFKGLVAERRSFSEEEIDRLADGSVFSGRQAIENGLIDALGGRDEAKAWLVEQDVDADLPIIEWKRQREQGLLLPVALADYLSHLLGVKNPSEMLPDAVKNRLLLDGLVSVWHVPASSEGSGQ